MMLRKLFSYVPLLSLVIWGKALGATVPYSTDFESPVGAEWSSSATESATAFTRFAGRYSTSAITLTLTGLTPGTSYTLAWDLYVIDSWDGNSGPDTFSVLADTAEVFRYTFSNYNGDPPSQPQSYPNQPDTGRVHMGFNASHVDAIYRNLEVAFTPAAATAVITFRGLTLQDISDESWGIDNVRVQSTASVSPTSIASTTLPDAGATSERAYDSFTITATRNLDATTAAAAANYSLREAGADHTLGNGDDVIFTLVPSFASGKTVSFTIPTNPLQPGNYRFTVGTVKDSLGTTVTAFVRDFTVADPILGKIEKTSDETLPEATALTITESPSGSGLFTAIGHGSFDRVGDVDYWRFDAEAGSVVTVRVDCENGNISPQIYLQNASGSNLATLGGGSTSAHLQNYTIAGPGTYYLRVFNNSNRSQYRLRLQQTRNLQQESEANNTAPGNALNLAFTSGSYQGKITGALDLDDGAGDHFRVGVLNVGNALSANLTMPTGASVSPAGVQVDLFVEGNATPVATSATGALNHTVTTDGLYYFRLTTTNLGTRAQYVLSVNAVDTVKPQISGTSLPAAGSTTTNILNGFTLNFSEDFLVSAVQDAANYELRGAGGNGTYGDSDDLIYTVANSAYTGGLSATYSITDGPIQPGLVRFTAKNTLADRTGNTLAAAFVREFTVATVPGFTFEGRLNDDLTKATRLGAVTSTFDETFTHIFQISGGGNNQWGAVHGDFNGDGKLDLATGSYGSDRVIVYFGNGDGTLQAGAIYGTANQSIGIAAGDFNGDGKLDLVTANYGSGNSSVLLNNGDGTFATAVNYAMASQPRSVIVADFNGDSKLDFATANANAANLSVRLGVGDGTFLAQVNYATASQPWGIAAGDFNGDGKLDLATANVGGDNISILLGNGDGTFQAKVDYSTGAGSNPRSLVIGNFDGAAGLDIVSMNANNTYSFLHGNADGTFAAAVNAASNTSDPYQVRAADLDSDGRLDFVIASYGQSRLRVFMGNGNGTFREGQSMVVPGNPIALTLADFNGDGILDAGTSQYGNHTASISIGNAKLNLAEDPAGSGIRTLASRGSLSGSTDVDYWTFTGTAGDGLVIAAQTPGNPGNSGLYFDLYYSNGEGIWTFNADSSGWGQNGAYTLPYSGRYLIRVRPWHQYYGEYRFRLTLARPPTQLEDENNNAINQANRPTLAQAPNTQSATILGYVSVGDGSGDFYSFGQLAFGTEIRLRTTKPSTSGFVPILQILNGAGAVVASSPSGQTNLTYAIPSGQNGVYYGRVLHDGTGDQFTQYILAAELVDTAPPIVTSVTLPSEGSNTTLVSPNFSVTFTEDMQASTVQSAASYDLRAKGADNTFDTADDILYTAQNQGYAVGTVANYVITDGPLQPGSYRFTIKTTIQDRFGLALAASYVRLFTVDAVSGFIFENRNNSGLGNATSLSLAPGTTPDGSFMVGGTTPGSGNNPWGLDIGDVNNDGKLDAVVGAYGGDNITVFLGSGNGAFTARPSFASGSNPLNLRLADFNGDNKLDIVSVDYGTTTVSVFLGAGDGSFGPRTPFTVGSSPRCVAVGDLNGDGYRDIVTANWGSANISVLLGNGAGSFATQVRYTAGSNPDWVSLGDVNGDGQADIVVANYNADNIGVFINQGAGAFGAMTTYATPNGPRALALGDLNGDAKLDIAVITIANQLAIFTGSGTGTFTSAFTRNAETSDPYSILIRDVTADGKPDVVIGNYGQSMITLMAGKGDGDFGPPLDFRVNSNPINVEAGDFNGDGVTDLVAATYNSPSLAFIAGQTTEYLTEDPVGSGFRHGTGRGNLDSSTDEDFWSFSAKAGETLIVATETPGNLANSGRWYEILNPNGDRITYFYADARGWGQSDPIAIAHSGTYYVVVHWWHNFTGEYRMRLSLAPPGMQMESESTDNNVIARANTIGFVTAAGKQTASVGGYHSVGDGADHFRLGNLSTGTAIRLNTSKPASSGVASQLAVIDAAGNIAAVSAPGSTNIEYIVPAGSEGAYYARIMNMGPSRSGDAGPYIFFNGSSQYINTGNWSPGLQYTIEAWVRPDWNLYSDTDRRGIFGSYASCQDWGIVQYGNQLGLVYRPVGGACWSVLTTGRTLDLSQWIHIAGTSDGTTLRLYVNGELANSAPLPGDYNPTASGVWFGGSDWFYGHVDDAAVWNRALTAEEIQSSMNTIIGTEPNLRGLWRFEEGTGTAFSDASSQAHNGTAVNGPAWLDRGPTTARGNGLFAEYFLNIELADTTPPTITSVTLPVENSTNTFVPQYFNGGFSEDMLPETVNAVANYELRGAGLDNAFGTSDDSTYALALTSAYVSGLSQGYRIVDGPLQPGKYRFTISTALQDRSTSPLQQPYIRNFTVAGVPGYTLEDRDNDAWANADLVGLPLGAPGDGSFRALPNTAASVNGVYSIAHGDVNNDGHRDVVIAGYNSHNIAVYLGNGDGTFQTATVISLPNNPSCVAIADLNHDGNADLAVSNYGFNGVAILLGNGDGTFGAITRFPTSNNCWRIVVADFNNDTHMDIATANHTGDNVTVLIGTGAGTFAAGVNYAGGPRPYDIAAGDVNKDGKIDLITVSETTSTINVLLNDGTGVFLPRTSYPTLNAPRSVAVGDLNGDTWPDIVSVDSDSNALSIYRNKGDGTFELVYRPGTSLSHGADIQLADFDGDGRLDAAVVGYSSGNVGIFQGNGDCTFAPVNRYGIPGNPYQAAVADFNEDGALDIATGNYNGSNVGMLLGERIKPLAEDPAGSGLFHARGRGYIRDNSDYDYWMFSGKIGDVVEIASETPGNLSNSGQLFEFYQPDGERLFYFYPESSGKGHGYATLPVSGTYRLRVSRWHNYDGEYRFRVTIGRPPFQTEYDPLNNPANYRNDNLAQATPLTYQAGEAGQLTAKFFGYVHAGDPNDTYLLGNLSGGTRVQASLTKPLTSSQAPRLQIVDKNNAVVLESTTTDLDATVATTDPYYFRVIGENGGLNEQYIIALQISDVSAPTVTGSTLPAAGASSTAIIERFNVTFSEDMLPATARTAANYELRHAGPDNTFGTSDDSTYTLVPNYTSGLTASFFVSDGPLQPGLHRLRATSGLKDLAGVALSPVFERQFTMSQLGNFVIEDRSNGSIADATMLSLIEDPTGFKSAFARGNLTSREDFDYYGFSAVAGQKFTLAMEVPGNPGASQLYYQLFRQNGTRIWDGYAENYTGWGQVNVDIPADDNYYVAVRYNYDYFSEYNLRINLSTPPLIYETENNDTIANANTITLANGANNTKSGSAAGYIRLTADFDYFKLPGLTAGTTVFLSTTMPGSNPLAPTVALYNAAGGYMAEAANGRPFDGVAQVDITTAGDYYALVRNSGAEGNLRLQYVLNAQTAPTDLVNFPNLQVTAITVPTSPSILSGQQIPLIFTVSNIGRAATPSASWTDRVILSQNTIVGDSDDIQLPLIQHNGALAANASYEFNQLVLLPDGISGPFYIIVQTDFGNAVNEFALEGDNITASATAFNVGLNNYPDMVVEDLVVTGPVNNVFTINWTLANRGNRVAAGGFGERVQVRNVESGAFILNEEANVLISSFSPGQTALRSKTVTATAAAHYQVIITEDTRNDLFEFDAISHAHAEQNAFETAFEIKPRYTVAVSSNPGAGGTVGGAGTFVAGDTVTVTAAPNTSTLPYQFLNWTEGGIFQSANSSYAFTLAGNRSLVANFVLPTFTINVSSQPANAGTIIGGGSAAYGSTVTLNATPRFGYKFDKWTEGGTTLGLSPSLTFQALANRAIVANFADANLTHEVTTATLPAGIATVTGGGTFNNGQSTTFTAPASITQNLTVYTFKRYTVGGVEVGSSRILNKTFATTDPTAMQFVAEYDSRSLYPLVTRATTSLNSPIPVTPTLFLTLQFNRSMKPGVTPQITFVRTSGAGTTPTVAAGGVWSATDAGNDTYRTPAINIAAGMDGEFDVRVSGGEDLDGAAVQLATAVHVQIDATLPAISAISETPGSGSVRVQWTTDEPATSQVDYGTTSALGRSSPLNVSLDTNHVITVTGLLPDTQYFYKVRSRDRAGNERLGAERAFRTLKAPDLQIDSITINEPAGGIQSGATVEVVWIGRNTGVGPTSGAWFDQLIVSNRTTGTLLLDASLRYDVETGGDVVPNGTREFRRNVTLPEGPAGVGQIAFTVRADFFNNQTEDNAAHNAEGNNISEVLRTSTIRPYADLIAQNLAIAPANPKSGDLITVTWQDANTGAAPVTSAFRDRIVIRNTLRGIVYVDTQIAHDPSAVLNAGGTVARSHSFRLPNGATGVGPIRAEVTVDVANNIFEHNATATGESNNGANTTVDSTLAAYPDLAVTAITAPTNGAAGSTIEVTYTVKNLGNGDAGGPWSDFIFLSSDTAIGSDEAIAAFTYNGNLAPNAEISFTRSITLPRFGTGNRWVVVRTDNGGTVYESDEANNTTIDDRALILPSNLFFTLSRNSIQENWGANAAYGTVTRNSGTGNSLEVTIQSSDTSEASVPATVIIPTGQVSATFPISAIDDPNVDGTKNVTITVSAPGFDPLTQPLQVLDEDQQTLTVQIAAATVRENAAAGTVSGVVTRNNSTVNPLSVKLVSSDPTILTVPATVVIPAGQTQVIFPITMINNSVPNRVSRVLVSPLVNGYHCISDSVDIQDDDLPTLTLAFAETTISEGKANPATEGTITRNPVINQSLTVLIHNEDPTIAKAPASVVIPANVASVSFPVTVVNNTLVESTRMAHFMAFTADAFFGTAIEEGSSEAHLFVTDDDGPTLTLAVNSELLSESGTIIGTVTRNTPTTSALTVQLQSQDLTEATVPGSVTIPVGQRSANFTISGVSDGSADGIQRVALTATSAGYAPGSVSFNVTDIDLPDLRVTSISAPSNALSSAQITVTWNIRNEGLSIANSPWSDRVYTSTSPDGSNLQLLGQYFRTSPLAVGEAYDRSALVTLPTDPGRYYIVVVTDSNSNLSEGSRRNNTLVSAQPIVVAPAYRAVVSTDVETSLMGAPIPLTGRAFSSVNGDPVPFARVTIRVLIKGTRRIIEARADASGNFQATFQPLPGEAGLVTFGADHPGVATDPEQDQVSIYGMRFANDLTHRMVPQSELTGEIELQNIGNLPLSGLTAVGQDLPPNVNVQFQIPATIPASGKVMMGYKIIAGDITQELRWRFNIRAAAQQGAVAFSSVNLTVAPLRAQLVANPGFLNRGMVRGARDIVSFDLSNMGGAGSGPLEVRLPNVPWLSLVSGTNIPALAPGESNRVTISLNPAADLPLTRYDGSFVIAGGSGVGVEIPFSLRAISDNFGDLKVTVVDDYTFHAQGAPKVAGANVLLTDPLTGQTVGSGITDTNGIASFVGLREGSYQMTVTAQKHSSFRSPVTIVPGVETEVQAFLDRETVSYRWTVVPTEIEDHYKIVLETVFETEVPVPVVVIENPMSLPLVVQGHDTQFEIRVSNKGLIAAEQVHLVMPTHPDFEIIPLVEQLDTLPARSTMAIPVLIRAKPTAQAATWAQVQDRLKRQSSGGGGGGGTTFTGCEVLPKLELKWSFVCGPDRRWHVNQAEIVPVYVDESCWDKIKDLLEDKLTGDPRDLLDWPGQLCDIAAVLASCVDECLATIVKMACGVAQRDVVGAVKAALGFGNCWCPSLPSLGGGTISGGGGGGGTGGGYYGGQGYSPGYPTGVPFHWDYSPDCRPGDTVSGGGPITDQRIASDKKDSPKASAGSVCARVRLRIVQEAVITRAAFLGTLELENGNTDLGLTDIQVTLDIRDEFNNPANSKFGIREPILNGITAIDGTGTIGAGGTGSVQYTMIPNREAAPEGPTIYRIGGTLKYKEGDNVVEVPLLPDTITAFPDPVLNLVYFQQRDVYADDPHTDPIEPSEPFALGLLVKNTGKGSAINFKITSAQPEIIENEKGLLIDFKIIGTQVGGEEIQPSLTANLGRIDPGQARTATWSLISTLQGKFIDYKATFEHIDSLGDARLSLIDSVEIHELIHQFQSQKAGSDTQPDFLVNDEADPQNTPDFVHLSDGSVAPVNLAANPQANHPAALGALQVQVTAQVVSGWTYLKMPDPGANYKLYRVVRSDGLELLTPKNAWTTDRTFPGSIAGAIRENLFHLVDFDSTGSYTLYYRVDDSVAPTFVQMGDLPSVRTSPLASATVTLSEEIDLATFNHQDISLTLNGGANLINSSVTIERIEGSLYRINGLSGLTDEQGNYLLTVIGAGVQDYGGNATVGSISVSWARTGLNPVITSVTRPTSPRNTPVISIDVTFSKALNNTTFTPGDISLTLNDGPNLVGDVVAVEFVTGSTFRLTGLGAVTSDNGVYKLTVNGTGVADSLGNIGIGQQTVSWTMDVTPPGILAFEEIRTNPRNIVVPSLEVDFTEPVQAASFTIADLTLTRNAGANLIDNRVLITPLSPTRFRISEFSWVSGAEGTYLFTVNAAGVLDAGGNSGVGTASRTWVMDTTKPPMPAALTMAPDTGASSTDLITRDSDIVVSGTVGEDSLRVRFHDTQADEDLGYGEITSRAFTKTMKLPNGSRSIRVTAIDSAGNVSLPAYINPTIDLVPPTVTIAQVTPDPRDTTVSSIDVTFSEDIEAAKFTRTDVTLTRNAGTNLIDGGVTILFVSGRTYRISGLGALTGDPGLYELTVVMPGVADVAGNAGVVSPTESWRRTGANTPPVFDALTQKFISPEQQLVVDVTARDFDLPEQQLAFSLGAGAPSGVAITSAGQLTWTPTRAQSGQAYDIPIVVADNGTPPLSANASLRVTVIDYAELNLGRGVVERGFVGHIPIEFFASTPVNDVQLDFDVPIGETPDLRVEALTAEIATLNLVNISPGKYRLTIRTVTGQTLSSRKVIAELLFTPPEAPSAFVHLRPTAMVVKKPDTTGVGAVFMTPGRLVAIGHEPLLEAILLPNGREVILYAKVGRTYRIDESINLLVQSNWGGPQTVTPTALETHLPVTNPAGTLYFRGRQTSP